MTILDRHYVHVVGRGDRTLFLSHGFGCNQSMFRYMVEELREDYRMVLYDLAGSGNYPSELFNAERYQSLVGYAQDAIAIAEALEFNDMVFVGHSVSSMIGVLAANRRPDLFSSLVLIGPSARYINDGDYYGGFSEQDIDELLQTMGSNYQGWSAAMAPAIMGNTECPELGGELTDNFCRTNPVLAQQFAEVTFRGDNRADLPQVSVPTLVLQCREDIIASEEVGRYVHEHIAGSEFVILDARGHCPNLSAPGQTSAAVRNFLSGIEVGV